jgi:hypothetical protein
MEHVRIAGAGVSFSYLSDDAAAPFCVDQVGSVPAEDRTWPLAPLLLIDPARTEWNYLIILMRRPGRDRSLARMYVWRRQETPETTSRQHR